MKNYIFVILYIFMYHSGLTQTAIDPPKYPSDLYPSDNNPNKRPISYTSLREADAMWSKRIWRVIDLREKINHPLYYPDIPILDRKSLFDALTYEALNTEKITCFGNPVIDDEFRYTLTKSEVAALLLSYDTMDVEDPLNPGTFEKKAIPKEITSADVWKYWIKEDWFFDKQKSVMEVRIIGICPVVEKKDQNGNRLGADKPLFWVYFPEARPILAKTDVYVRNNNSNRRTLDDIFWKRMFSSYVRKESNVYDRIILDYKEGLDALLEAERVKSDIFKFEHDLWHF